MDNTCCCCCCCCMSDDEEQMLPNYSRLPVTTQPRHQVDSHQARKGQSDNPAIEYRDVVIQKLKAEVHELEERNDKLLTRLSERSSAMLTYNNPNIADLSDMNRPTKLAEQFSELYDNEWTDGFDALLNQRNKTEKEICEILLRVLVVIFSKCHEKAKADVQTITTALLAFSGADAPANETLKALTVERKKHYSVGIKAVGEELKELLRREEQRGI